MRKTQLRSLSLLSAALLITACPARVAPARSGQANGPAENAAETRGPDPRSAFEGSGLLGGISASPESHIVLIEPKGVPEAGVSLALGGALSTAAISRRIAASPPAEGFAHELILASGAKAILPGPVLCMAASGERIVVACVDSASDEGGSLLCFKAEGEGERLIEAWKTPGYPSRRLIAVPGGRVAASDEAAGLRVIDASTGAEAWALILPSNATDIAYAPGLVLAAVGSSLGAYDESNGTPAWSAALTAASRSVSAGNGVALVLAASGSLSAFSLADGMGVGAAPGPFDPALRPIADGARAIAALIGGGAAEIDVKSGQTLRSWSWDGATAFLAADRDRIFAGLDGREGKGILVSSRAGEDARMLVELDSGAFDSPVAVTGARGGLLSLLMDGSLVLIGKEMAQSGTSSTLEAAVAPQPEIAASISEALGRFKPGESIEPRRYLRFDLFAQGIPVDTGVAFTAFKLEASSSAKRSFFAKPASGGSVVAIYDESGREMAASIDELASSSIATAYLEKGKAYWIVAGWLFQASPETYRLYLK